MQSTALTKTEAAMLDKPNAAGLDIFNLGKVFAESGYFSDTRDAAKAVVRILAGREMGFEAFVSMANIHIVQGKPVLGATLIAAAIKKSGKYTFRVVRHDETVCEIEFFERCASEAFQSIGKSSFSIDEAKIAGLTGKDNWKKHPQDMLFARAISRGAKWHCPDIFGGAIYTPGEIEESPGTVVPIRAESAAKTIPPTGPDSTDELKDAHLRRKELVKKIYDLCRKLINAGDRSLDSTGKLKNYVNEKFEVSDGLDALDFEGLAEVVTDLEERVRVAEENAEEEEPVF